MSDNRREALEALRDVIRDGGTPSLEMIFAAFPDRGCFNGFPVGRLFDWALDPEDIRAMGAVKALHKAVLPDLGWKVTRVSKYPGMIPGSSPFEFRADVGWGTTWVGRDDDPARAWLLAILSALISETPKGETP